MKAELMTISNTHELRNHELAKRISELSQVCAGALMTAKAAQLHCAKTMGEIAKTNLYKDDFESAHKCAQEILGLSEPRARALVNVGLGIVNETLPTIDKNGIPFDFSALEQMLPIKEEKRTELRKAVENGTVTADMSKNDIVDAVAEFKTKRKAATRKEKELSIFNECTGELVAVTTRSNFIVKYGEPFGEFNRDGKIYLVYDLREVETKAFHIYSYSTGKIVDAENSARE